MTVVHQQVRRSTYPCSNLSANAQVVRSNQLHTIYAAPSSPPTPPLDLYWRAVSAAVSHSSASISHCCPVLVADVLPTLHSSHTYSKLAQSRLHSPPLASLHCSHVDGMAMVSMQGDLWSWKGWAIECGDIHACHYKWLLCRTAALFSLIGYSLYWTERLQCRTEQRYTKTAGRQHLPTSFSTPAIAFSSERTQPWYPMLHHTVDPNAVPVAG